MDKLPPEILNRIFIQLTLEQRGICLFVCRSWWRVLDGYCLFYSAELEKDTHGTGRCMKMLLRRSDRAAKVKEVSFTMSSRIRFDRAALLNVFPNARVIKAETTCSPMEHYHLRNLNTTTYSNSKVQSLSDFHNCELACQMLYSNLTSQLKTLFLDFHYITNTRGITSQLKNLPVLNKLTLKRPLFQFQHLEEIHENVPSIQELALEGVAIKKPAVPSETLSATIPATAIKRLKFYYGVKKNTKTQAQLYQYMTKKYVNVNNIDYSASSLKNYDNIDRKYIYANGMLDFYKFIAPKQSELSVIQLPDDVNPFEALEEVDSQIKAFSFSECHVRTLIQFLSQSTLCEHVERLAFQNSDFESYPLLKNSDIGSFHLFKNMTSLTHLKLCFSHLSDKYLPMNLIDCFVSCPPGLKVLDIDCNLLTTGPHNFTLDSVETLKINCETLTSTLGDILSSCFPNLVELGLSGQVKENVKITIQSPRFQEAFLDPRQYVFDVYGFSFKSPNQTGTQYYRISGEKADQVQYEDIEHLPLLSFESFTEKLVTTPESERWALIKVLPY